MSGEPLGIWKELALTDPKHTKEFKRAGGFSGTAIRPMYAIQKMTELFGPCGIGWGYTKPEYTIQQGNDGQVLVYCVVGLWHSPETKITGSYAEHGDLVYGVGGDFVIVKQSSGLRSDDEAFKKAFTDALMNAMKHIGMSADIHMNQFDANKYVDSKSKAKGDVTPENRESAADLWAVDQQEVWYKAAEMLFSSETSVKALFAWEASNGNGKRFKAFHDEARSKLLWEKYVRALRIGAITDIENIDGLNELDLFWNDNQRLLKIRLKDLFTDVEQARNTRKAQLNTTT